MEELSSAVGAACDELLKPDRRRRRCFVGIETSHSSSVFTALLDIAIEDR